jgi:hypothetical protein
MRVGLRIPPACQRYRDRPDEASAANTLISPKRRPSIPCNQKSPSKHELQYCCRCNRSGQASRMDIAPEWRDMRGGTRDKRKSRRLVTTRHRKVPCWSLGATNAKSSRLRSPGFAGRSIVPPSPWTRSRSEPSVLSAPLTIASRVSRSASLHDC